MSTVQDSLQKLEHLVESLPLTGREHERLARDLSTIILRLASGSYEIHSFSGNALNLVERNRDFFSELQFYSGVGRTWSRLFAQLDLEKQDECLDLCAGYFPKVELGLHYLGFKGKVRVLNKDAEALAGLEKFLTFLDIKFPVETRELDIFLDSFQPSRLVVANHIVDDLIIDTFAERFGTSAQEIYGSEDTLRKFWSEVAKTSSHAGEVTQRLSSLIEKATHKNGVVFLVQYPSYTERSLKLEDSIRVTTEVCESLCRELSPKGFTRDTELAVKALSGFPGMFLAQDCYVLKRAA